MSAATLPNPQTRHWRLIDQVNDLKSTLARDLIQVTDMSRASSLESGIGADPADTALAGDVRQPVDIVRLEGPIMARQIEDVDFTASRFRFFLDGAQKTLPVCRLGLTPVVVALSAVGVLYRDTAGQPALMGDLLRVNQTWIAPRRTGNPDLDAMIRRLEDDGESVEDQHSSPIGTAGGTGGAIGDYGKSLAFAFDLAGRIRGDQERAALDHWRREVSPDHPDDWIAVDGRLRENVPNAVGIVKDLQTQHLEGHEAVALFDMPKGCRTTAFRYASSGADVDADESLAQGGDEGRQGREGRTMWYMRLWGAAGMDARHSLIRIEAPHAVDSSEQIDEISRWILAERLPRATEDPRWPTLLYPISYLERILKRRLANITAGWPS